MITSSVVCYRAALHRRRASSSAVATSIAAAAVTTGCNQTPGSKDWCILSLNYRNMCSSSDVVPAPNKRLNNKRSSSPTASESSSNCGRSSHGSLLTVTSPSNSLKSVGLDKISLGSSNKSSFESAGRRVAANHSPVLSLESLQQCDDNDNLVSNNSTPRHNSSRSTNSGGAHFKCRKALGKSLVSTFRCILLPEFSSTFTTFSSFLRLSFILPGLDFVIGNQYHLKKKKKLSFFFFSSFVSFRDATGGSASHSNKISI